MMYSTAEIVDMGLECLVEKLGIINAEHFIATIKRERFDYTAWQREYFAQILISSRRRIVKSNAESGIGYTDILIMIPSEKLRCIMEVKDAKTGGKAFGILSMSA